MNFHKSNFSVSSQKLVSSYPGEWFCMFLYDNRSLFYLVICVHLCDSHSYARFVLVKLRGHLNVISSMMRYKFLARDPQHLTMCGVCVCANENKVLPDYN